MCVGVSKNSKSDVSKKQLRKSLKKGKQRQAERKQNQASHHTADQQWHKTSDASLLGRSDSEDTSTPMSPYQTPARDQRSPQPVSTRKEVGRSNSDSDFEALEDAPTKPCCSTNRINFGLGATYVGAMAATAVMTFATGGVAPLWYLIPASAPTAYHLLARILCSSSEQAETDLESGNIQAGRSYEEDPECHDHLQKTLGWVATVGAPVLFGLGTRLIAQQVSVVAHEDNVIGAAAAATAGMIAAVCHGRGR